MKRGSQGRRRSLVSRCLRRGLHWGLLIGLAASALAVMLARTGALQMPEMRLLDWRVRLAREPFAPQVIVVGLGEKQPQRYRRTSRSELADIISRLHADGARAIMLDVQLDTLLPHARAGEDLKLIGAMAKAGNVVLPVQLNAHGRIVPPAGLFRAVAAGVGHVQGELSPGDGVIRWVRPVLLPPAAEHQLPAAVTVAWELATGRRDLADKHFTSYAQVARALQLPLTAQGKLYITYSPRKQVSVVPASELLAGHLPAQWFRNRVALVGATSPAAGDRHRDPFSSAQQNGNWEQVETSGVRIQAQALSTLFSPRRLHELDPRWQLALVVLLAVAVALGAMMLPPLWAVPYSCLLFLAVPVAALNLFRDRMLVVACMPLMAGVAIAYLAAASLRFLVLDRAARTARRTFARYLHPRVVEEILADAGPRALARTQRRTVTLLFSDIRNYTGLVAAFTPEETIGLLNEYFTLVSGEVLKRDGFIEDYVGDGMMAVFGLFSDHSYGALEAVQTALAMEEAVRRNRESGGKLQFRVGIGIHTGEIVAGNVGSPQRTDYTTIGPAVNLTARVEAMTKELGVQILLTEATYILVAEAVDVRDCGEHELRGFGQRQFHLYELGGLKERKQSP